MHYVVLGEHSAEVCPTGNAKTRALMLDIAPQIPKIAEKNNVKIVAGPFVNHEHITVVVVEADRGEDLDTFITESRLNQWNTLRILPSRTMQEGMQEIAQGSMLF